MTEIELIALIVTGIGVLSFSAIFTILYRSYTDASISELRAGKRDVELIDEAIYNGQPHIKRRTHTVSIFKRVLFWVALAIVLPLFGVTIYNNVTGGVTFIGGKSIMVVASGSMSEKNQANLSYLTNLNNQFPTNSIIVLEKVESSSELQLYDVIAFRNDEGNNIIHRIIDVQYTASGVKYVTRGDSNNSDDKFQPSFNDVIGKYTGTHVPYVGLFILFFQSYGGMLTVAAIIYCLVMIDRTTAKLHAAQEERFEILERQIDFKNNEWDSDHVLSVYNQTIYFKGYAYTFDDKGFIDKREVTKEETKRVSEEHKQRLSQEMSEAEEASEAPLPPSEEKDDAVQMSFDELPTEPTAPLAQTSDENTISSSDENGD